MSILSSPQPVESTPPRRRFRLLPPDENVGWTPFAWLIYLAFFFVEPLARGASTLEWALTLGAVAAFLPLYLRGYWLTGRSLLPIILGIAALGVAFLPTNRGASVFFIYAASFVGYSSPCLRARRYVLLLALLLMVESWIVDVPIDGWVVGLLFTLIIGGINIHFAENRRRDARLRLAQDDVERLAKLDERERIARDLHDLLGHSLSLVTLKSQLAARLAERSDSADARRAAREMREVESISRQAMSEVRRAVRGFRAQKLGNELAKARMALEMAGIELELESGPYDLTSDQESVVALALREAVLNVVRHAGATGCRVRLRTHAGHFLMEIEDDGRGMEGAEGSGLTGMRERLAFFGGRLELPPAERGTLLRIELPLQAPTALTTAAAERL